MLPRKFITPDDPSSTRYQSSMQLRLIRYKSTAMGHEVCNTHFTQVSACDGLWHTTQSDRHLEHIMHDRWLSSQPACRSLSQATVPRQGDALERSHQKCNTPMCQLRLKKSCGSFQKIEEREMALVMHSQSEHLAYLFRGGPWVSHMTRGICAKLVIMSTV